MNTEIIVKDHKIRIMMVNNIKYISLTDLARYANEEEHRLPIRDWLRSKEVLLYLGIWGNFE